MYATLLFWGLFLFVCLFVCFVLVCLGGGVVCFFVFVCLFVFVVVVFFLPNDGITDSVS